MPLSIDQRMECLREAIKIAMPGSANPSHYVEAAMAFAAFVENGKAQTQLEADVAELNAPAPKAKKPTGVLAGSEAKEIKLGGSAESRTKKDPLTDGGNFDDVKKYTLELRDKVSKEAVRETLEGYGAKTIQDLADIQWKGYVMSCKAKIEKAAATDDFGV